MGLGESPREQAVTGVALTNQLVLQHILHHLFANDLDGLQAVRDACLAEQEALFARDLGEEKHFMAQVGLDALESLFSATRAQIERSRASK